MSNNSSARDQSIDALRGVVMMLMALDHTRDFFGRFNVQPTNLRTTTVVLFFTRWITHFCAPVFVLLAGTSARLLSERKGTSYTQNFLAKRGLWLIFLELTVIRIAWTGDIWFKRFLLQVIWAIGWSMLFLALLLWVRMSVRAIALLGGAMVVLHNLLDRYSATSFGAFKNLWAVLHQPLRVGVGHRTVMILYPLIPWIGVLALGYALGEIFLSPEQERKKQLQSIGIRLVIVFITLRALDLYGDRSVWRDQSTTGLTIASFLNTEKYPPSLQYLLMTLGPSLIALAHMDRVPKQLLDKLVLFGKVPLFYYIAHLYLLGALSISYVSLVHGRAQIERFARTGIGASLPVVYIVWVMVLLLLYPACRWFSATKQQYGENTGGYAISNNTRSVDYVSIKLFNCFDREG